MAAARGDRDVLEMLDEVCEEVAERLLVAKDEIREVMMNHGYDD
ncbi:hypothetical protein [Micromonospora sp. DT47]